MSQRDWFEKDYYKILGVPSNATKDEIKKAYRKLAQKHHPDANEGDAAATARFKEISEAQSILSNDKKRREYDEVRRLAEAGGERIYGFRPGAGGRNVRVTIGDLFDNDGGAGGLFDDLLGGFGFRPRPNKGEDIETAVTLTFDQAVAGETVTIPQGGRVRIPAGVGDGARIRVPGKGGPAGDGGMPGDLYVRVRVSPHPIFTRGQNGDLTVTVPITFTEAVLGTKIEVPTLDGSVTVKVPAGTENGKTLRVRGRGAPRQGGGTGDLFVRVEVEVPRRVSRRERELLEEFGRIHDHNPRAHLEQYLQDGKKNRKAS